MLGAISWMDQSWQALDMQLSKSMRPAPKVSEPKSRDFCEFLDPEALQSGFSIMCKMDAAVLGGQTAGGHPKAFLGTTQLLFAVPASRESSKVLESVSTF